MPTAAHATNMAANPGRGNDRANEAAPSTTERPPHVENLTRVTVAFPFATINTAEPDTQHTVEQLVRIVAALASQLDAGHATPATAELANEARALERTVTGKSQRTGTPPSLRSTADGDKSGGPEGLTIRDGVSSKLRGLRTYPSEVQRVTRLVPM